jgi:hypothetical protein
MDPVSSREWGSDFKEPSLALGTYTPTTYRSRPDNMAPPRPKSVVAFLSESTPETRVLCRSLQRAKRKFWTDSSLKPLVRDGLRLIHPRSHSEGSMWLVYRNLKSQRYLGINHGLNMNLNQKFSLWIVSQCSNSGLRVQSHCSSRDDPSARPSRSSRYRVAPNGIYHASMVMEELDIESVLLRL